MWKERNAASADGPGVRAGAYLRREQWEWRLRTSCTSARLARSGSSTSGAARCNVFGRRLGRRVLPVRRMFRDTWRGDGHGEVAPRVRTECEHRATSNPHDGGDPMEQQRNMSYRPAQAPERHRPAQRAGETLEVTKVDNADLLASNRQSCRASTRGRPRGVLRLGAPERTDRGGKEPHLRPVAAGREAGGS